MFGIRIKQKKGVWLMEVARPVATVLSHLSEEALYKPNASTCKYTNFFRKKQGKL